MSVPPEKQTQQTFWEKQASLPSLIFSHVTVGQNQGVFENSFQALCNFMIALVFSTIS